MFVGPKSAVLFQQGWGLILGKVSDYCPQTFDRAMCFHGQGVQAAQYDYYVGSYCCSTAAAAA
jgi:hypothetical protein